MFDYGRSSSSAQCEGILPDLIDIDLSPQWIEVLADAGIEARHWSTSGDGAASDPRKSSQWPPGHGFVLLTHDLDGRRTEPTPQRSMPPEGFDVCGDGGDVVLDPEPTVAGENQPFGHGLGA